MLADQEEKSSDLSLQASNYLSLGRSRKDLFELTSSERKLLIQEIYQSRNL